MKKVKPTKLHVKGPEDGRGVTVTLDGMKFKNAHLTDWSYQAINRPVYDEACVARYETQSSTVSVTFLTERGVRIMVVGEHIDFRWEK